MCEIFKTEGLLATELAAQAALPIHRRKIGGRMGARELGFLVRLGCGFQVSALGFHRTDISRMSGYQSATMDRFGFSGKTNRRRGELGSLGKPKCHRVVLRFGPRLLRALPPPQARQGYDPGPGGRRAEAVRSLDLTTVPLSCTPKSSRKNVVIANFSESKAMENIRNLGKL